MLLKYFSVLVNLTNNCNSFINKTLYTAAQKYGISKILRESLCSSRLYLFDQKYRKKTVILWNIFAIYNIGFLLKKLLIIIFYSALCTVIQSYRDSTHTQFNIFYMKTQAIHKSRVKVDVRLYSQRAWEKRHTHTNHLFVVGVCAKRSLLLWIKQLYSSAKPLMELKTLQIERERELVCERREAGVCERERLCVCESERERLCVRVRESERERAWWERERLRGGVWERLCVWEREAVCVCERERERERLCVCERERLCVWERERGCVCVRERERGCVCLRERGCVRVRVRERLCESVCERERLCVCERERERLCVCERERGCVRVSVRERLCESECEREAVWECECECECEWVRVREQESESKRVSKRTINGNKTELDASKLPYA